MQSCRYAKHVCTAKATMHGTGTKTRARQKHYDRLLFINVQSLKQFYLQDTAPPTFIQKERKGYPQRRGCQTGSIDLYGVEPG